MIWKQVIVYITTALWCTLRYLVENIQLKNTHSLVTPKMGLCGRCLQVSGYTVVVLVAILLYFHLECQKEKEENMKNKTNSQFLPETTNCFVELGYTMKGKDMELKMGE